MIKLNPQNVRYIIIHHTATKRDRTKFWSVKKNHIKRGWGDIGYHYFITPRRIYKGRSEEFVGAHCKYGGFNFKSLGVCLTGNFEKEYPTQSQISFLGQVVDELCARYRIPRANILGHRETGAKTLCPGKNLLPYIEALRKQTPKPTSKIREILGKISKIVKNLKVILKKLQKRTVPA